MSNNDPHSDEKYSFLDFSQISVCGGPVWNPQGNSLFYVSNMSGNNQIYHSDVKRDFCLWPTRVTYSEDRTTVPMTSENGSLCFHKDNGGNERWQIYLMQDPLSRKAVDLTKKKDSKHLLHVFTEKKIIFTANRDDLARFDVYELDIENTDSLPVRLIENKLQGMLSVSDFNKDEELLLCTERLSINESKFHIYNYNTKEFKKIDKTDKDAWMNGKFVNNNQIICISNLDRDKKALAILNINSDEFKYLESEDESWETDYYYYHKDIQTIVWSKNQAGYTKLFYGKFENGVLTNRLEIPLPKKAVSNAGDYRSYLQPYSLNKAGNLLAINFDSSISLNNVYVIDLENNYHTWKVTNTNLGKISENNLVSESLINISSFDKVQFDSYLFLPEIQKKKKVPCIIMIHGGPEGQIRPNFNPLTQFFLYNEYAVALPNVRGSAGYGKEFNKLDDVQLRLDSVKDIAALAEHLKGNDLIDTSKLVVYGGSYGGFMVLSCITEFPTLFSAGIDIVGISNFVTFLENTADWRRKLREVEYGSLEKDREFLESISPIKKVDDIICPTLLIHGANDERVPVTETYQIEKRLNIKGIPVEMQIFDDEGHGVVKMSNRIQMYKKIIDFLEKYVKN